MARPHLTDTQVETFREAAARAGLELVEEQGADSLTLRSLAKRLGCSYAKPYTYYRDKEQLVDAVRGRAFERFGDFMREHRFGDAREQGRGYLRFAMENPETFRLMFELRQEFISESTRSSQARAWKICAQPIYDLVEAGELEGDPELIAHVSWAGLHGLASLALADQLYLGKSLDEIADGLTAVLDAFRPGTTQSSKP